jgi:mannose-1-phosphate guanylyltransferase/mannose-6-phosphate isomerase
VRASALILAGGSGTRFWPASRRRRPKQLLALDGERSLLAATVARLAPLVPAERVWISTTRDLATEVAAELPELDPERILVEPLGRNTAPAILGAVARLPPEARAEPLAVLPSDHSIADPDSFRSTLAAAFDVAARDGRVLALGVVPRWPETGFGYLELGGELPGAAGLRRVESFREKPDLATARKLVASGNHHWNAGMFVFTGERLLAAAREIAADLVAGAEAWAAAPGRDELYAALPAISIDYAVMEKLAGIATLPLDCGWDDLGSWSALFAHLRADADGNRVRGDAFAVDAGGNLLFADRGAVAVLGVEGLVVVQSGDVVLVVPRERAQEVRRLVERVASHGRDDLL